MGLSLDLKLPQLSGSLLYGDLSTAIHNPEFGNTVYIPDNALEKSKDFFYSVSPLFELKVEEYSFDKAAKHGELGK